LDFEFDKERGLAILLVNGFGRLVLLQNACCLQESIFCSKSRILGLCGDGNHAEVYHVDSDAAASSLELTVPFLERFERCEHTGILSDRD
jgi:hypothetical protein